MAKKKNRKKAGSSGRDWRKGLDSGPLHNPVVTEEFYQSWLATSQTRSAAREAKEETMKNEERDREWKLSGGDAGQKVLKTFRATVEDINEEKRQATIVVSSDDVDRDGEVVWSKAMKKAIKSFLKHAPLLHSHKWGGDLLAQIGHIVALKVVDGQTWATMEWYPGEGINDNADWGWKIALRKMAAFSIGFLVNKRLAPGDPGYPEQFLVKSEDGEDRPRGPMVYSDIELLEISQVLIPSNRAAVQERAAAEDAPELEKEMAEMALKSKGLFTEAELIATAEEAERNRGHDTARFEPPDSPSMPANPYLGMLCDFLGCEVKSIHMISHMVRSAEVGNFLSAFKAKTVGHKELDVRNIMSNGTERPPLYESIQLNSKMEDSFLVDGISFRTAESFKYAVEFEVKYFGVSISIYANEKDADSIGDLLSSSIRHADENHVLRGEAFSLSGAILGRGENTWGDLFLKDEVKKPIMRAAKVLSEKGSSARNRGVILMGPPGTGKTLSGRIIKDEAKTTFIWISAKDFYYCGATFGLTEGFGLAAKLAPSVLFIEDVDNWLNSRTIDLLKTEMDGIDTKRGVLTILTSNHPETLPDAIIDRPGRFDDILHVDFPDEAMRSAMLQAWAPSATKAVVKSIAKDMEGYSGAHLKELVVYAGIIAEEDGLALDAALVAAVEKIREQRELIDELQVEGSKYDPKKGYLSGLAWTKGRSERWAVENRIVDEKAGDTVSLVNPPSVKEPAPSGSWKYCVCRSCGYFEEHKAGERCADKKCPECGEALIGSDEKPKSTEPEAVESSPAIDESLIEGVEQVSASTLAAVEAMGEKVDALARNMELVSYVVEALTEKVTDMIPVVATSRETIDAVRTDLCERNSEAPEYLGAVIGEIESLKDARSEAEAGTLAALKAVLGEARRLLRDLRVYHEDLAESRDFRIAEVARRELEQPEEALPEKGEKTYTREELEAEIMRQVPGLVKDAIMEQSAAMRRELMSAQRKGAGLQSKEKKEE